MLSEKELEEVLRKMLSRISSVNALYIRRVAEQIKTIGELNASSIHILNTIADLDADRNIAEITRKLAEATALNVADLMVLYQKALDDAVASPDFVRYVELQQEKEAAEQAEIKPKSQEAAETELGTKEKPLETKVQPLQYVPEETRARILNFTQAVSQQTAAKMYNLSNTTVIQETYKNAIDTAVTAVAAGYDSYGAASRDIIRKYYQEHTRGVLKDTAFNGIQVEYESGYRRRLDTAVRQNVIDGAKQINQQAAFMMGEALGFDAFEISAHMMSAPDHEPVQGHVFLKAEFEKMQNGFDCRDVDGKFYQGFRRPISEWNCGHFASPFDTEISKRRWSDEELAEYERKNAAGVEINGKHMTRYQASQYMRRLETEIRRWKDTANAAKTADDMELRRECQRHINKRRRVYNAVAEAAHIRPDPERLRVEGFRSVRV